MGPSTALFVGEEIQFVPFQRSQKFQRSQRDPCSKKRPRRLLLQPLSRFDVLNVSLAPDLYVDVLARHGT